MKASRFVVILLSPQFENRGQQNWFYLLRIASEPSQPYEMDTLLTLGTWYIYV